MYTGHIYIENEQEALRLMKYHLRMAAIYFEATPEVYPKDYFKGEFSERAMSVWSAAMEELYPND